MASILVDFVPSDNFDACYTMVDRRDDDGEYGVQQTTKTTATKIYGQLALPYPYTTILLSPFPGCPAP